MILKTAGSSASTNSSGLTDWILGEANLWEWMSEDIPDNTSATTIRIIGSMATPHAQEECTRNVVTISDLI